MKLIVSFILKGNIEAIKTLAFTIFERIDHIRNLSGRSWVKMETLYM